MKSVDTGVGCGWSGGLWARLLCGARVAGLVSVVMTGAAVAQPTCPGVGTVFSQQRITQYAGGFNGQLDPEDTFGSSVANIGDVDRDGVADLAVGAPRDDDGGEDVGAIWVLFMNSDRTVRASQKISSTVGGFTGTLDIGDRFGHSIGSIGDLNGDGRAELAVGAIFDDDGGDGRGAVWLLFLNADGTVASHLKISSTSGGFNGGLANGNQFGTSVGSIGDLNGDGRQEVAVGAEFDDDGGRDRGAVWILFLNANGTVASHQKISSTAGGFSGALDDADRFGLSVNSAGDINADGRLELAVGAIFDDDGGRDNGAVWILFLNANGTVASHQKISKTAGGFAGALDELDQFGASVAAIGDLNGDGRQELAVGASADDDGGFDRGAVWILFLNSNGTVASHQKISQVEGGFGDLLLNNGGFGRSSVAAGDINGDGRIELVVGANNGGPLNPGEIWVVSLNDCSIRPTIVDQPDSALLAVPGQIVFFNVVAQGTTPLSYRWRRNGVNLNNGGNIAGATTPTLIVFAGRGDVAEYDCVVTNAFGTVTSEAAVLGVALGCRGDFNDDGQVDFFDYLDFVGAFDAGCP